MSLAGLLTVAFPTFVFPNKAKLKSLEAEVGIGLIFPRLPRPKITTSFALLGWKF
jgi:hypothetical protein